MINKTAICQRCGRVYDLIDGCECLEWSAEELEDFLEWQGEDPYLDGQSYVEDEL